MAAGQISRFRLLRIGAAVLGGLAGFGYYYFVGCRTGTCPITGNPWISTLYGAVVGWLLAGAVQKESPAEKKGTKD